MQDILHVNLWVKQIGSSWQNATIHCHDHQIAPWIKSVRLLSHSDFEFIPRRSSNAAVNTDSFQLDQQHVAQGKTLIHILQSYKR